MDKTVEQIECQPSQSCRYLKEKQVDAAIVPVVDFFHSDGLQIVDHLGICAEGPVKSVLLCCHKPLEAIGTVRLDSASKTSNVLARILLERHFQVVNTIQYDQATEEADAEVIIADRALVSQCTGTCYDMAQEWQKMTGYGFVFAVWACRENHPDYVQIASILRKSKEKGQANVKYLSKLYSEKLGLEQDFCKQYLTKWIKYEIGPLQIEGMKLFRQFCQQLSV